MLRQHAGILSQDDLSRLPGHWILARMGKKVLRPGGRELTEKMIRALRITPTDDVIEFAPGLGFTTRMVIGYHPRSFIGIERDRYAARETQSLLASVQKGCKITVGDVEKTGLLEANASVVYGEAMLSMQANHHKANIIREALRLLRPGGRYGIHELCITPDNISPQLKNQIQKELAQAIHVNAQPLTPSEWQSLLVEGGFEVQDRFTAPMRLLKPGRIIYDEGLAQALRIGFNILNNPAARKRILAMRSVFNKYAPHLEAISLIAIKKVGT